MTHSHRLERLRARARDLSPNAGASGPPAAPHDVIALALEPLARVSIPVAAGLVALAAAAPTWTGAPASALLAGAPGLTLAILVWVARLAARRRVAMVLATTATGFLSLAAAPGLAALGASGPAQATGAQYQALCFVLAAIHLAVAWPCWRRANADGARARAARALHDEL